MAGCNLGHTFGSWVARRLDPADYLGRHLTLGVLLALAALTVFVAISLQVAGKAEPTIVDEEVGLGLYRHRLAHPGVTGFFRAVTWLGSVTFLTYLAVAVVLVLVLRGEGGLVVAWLLVLAGGALADGELKNYFQRERPGFADSHSIETTKSFPSGHSMGSFFAYGLLAYVFLRKPRPRWARRAVLLGVTLLVLLIGFSRVYLGAHWLSDVLGGYAAGAIWLAVWVTVLEVFRRRAQGLHRGEGNVPA